MRCANRHEWNADANNLMHVGSWCPECPQIGERIARAIFEVTFNSKFPKCKPQWLLEETGRKLELDGYSESLQLAFEYQGPHHFTNEDVRATDDLKRQACSKLRVRLVHIEWAKRPFPPSNVLINVSRAFSEAGMLNVPVMPLDDLFRRELAELQNFAKQKGAL